jgi:peptidoglycan/xylan/chitin deacetylase (PgdA/CDA1 family)
VLLVTVPSVIRVDDEGGLDGDFWRFTEASARRLFASLFPVDSFTVTAYGNVKTCAAFLYGVSADEMTRSDLDRSDPSFPLLIAVRAVKAPAERSSSRRTWTSTRTANYCGAILSYHRVADLSPDLHGLCTPAAEFREHMTLIRRECKPIALDDLVRAAASDRIPERAVAVTFDDGYLDALTAASPILSELGVPATFFVNSDRLDEEHERSWDVLERIFLAEPVLPPVLTLNVAGQSLRFATGTTDERADTLERLNQIMWPLDQQSRLEVVDGIIAWSRTSPAPRRRHRVLTGDEIRALAGRPGHSIGAHTVHHLALTTQPAATKRKEVFENKAALESLLQRPIQLFAYPYGEFDAELAGLVSEAGFRAAVTVEAGRVAAGANRLLLPRYEITAAARGAGFPRLLNEIFEGMTLCDRPR